LTRSTPKAWWRRRSASTRAEPSTHSCTPHAIIAAKVQDPTWQWLSLDARFLKGQQRSIGWVYAAALRAELSARLGVSWGPVSEGHGEIDGVARPLLELFSQRSAQVEAKTAELIAAWVDEHDGAEPDARALYRLERAAARTSRPSKDHAVEADALRAEWAARAREAGFAPLRLPEGRRSLSGASSLETETVITGALEAVAATSATWLRADLAREIAVRLPATAAPSGPATVELVDRWSSWLRPAASSSTRPAPQASAVAGTAGR